VSGTLTGGTNNNWDSGDVYEIDFSDGRAVTGVSRFTGTDDTSAAAATMTDSTASFTVDALIGLYIFNLTDGSFGVITDNTATVVTATLTGGTNNNWDSGDEYKIVPCWAGSHQGSNNANNLTDDAPNFNAQLHELAGQTIYNITDGSSAKIIDNFRDASGQLTVQTTLTGAHDGSGNASELTDSDAGLTIDEFKGFTINNTTDGSSATITTHTATVVTGTLAGGTDNDWDVSDVWTIQTLTGGTDNDWDTDDLWIIEVSEAGGFIVEGFSDTIHVGNADEEPYYCEGLPFITRRFAGAGVDTELIATVKKIESHPAIESTVTTADATGETLTDSTANFLTTDVGKPVLNITKGTRGFVRSVTSTTALEVTAASGTVTAEGFNATVLTDSAMTQYHIKADELAGLRVFNDTDGSVGTITSNTTTSITVSSLSGGTNNVFTFGDAYYVEGLYPDTTAGWGSGDGYAIIGEQLVLYDKGDYDLSTVSSSDACFIGTIPFRYGWKWLDFSSPHIKKSIKRINLDFEIVEPTYVIVESAINGRPVAVKREAQLLSTAHNKYVFEFHQGKVYEYGFRVYSYGDKQIRLQNYTVEFSSHA
jgi:hypothetical protein